MCGIPEIRFVIEADKRRMRRRNSRKPCSRPEDALAGKFLVQSPSELIHIHVSVAGGRGCCERSSVLRALFFDYLLEARQVREGAKHWAALVRRHVALKLKSHQTREARALVTGDKTPRCFRRDIAGAQVVVVLVEIVASGVGRVGFPVVGGPAVASRAVKGEMRLRGRI